MYWHNLLLSDENRYRIPRHLLFWTARLLFLLISFIINRFTMNPDPNLLWTDWFSWSIVVFMLQRISVIFICEILYCYAVIYWLLPKYLVKEKYVKFGAW